MADRGRQVLTEDEITARLVEIDRGQQLGGHHPDAEALDRARRILIGEIDAVQAYAELEAKYRIPKSDAPEQ